MIKKLFSGLQKYYALFAHLSKRERTVLYLAVFVISLTLLDRLIIFPIYSKMKSLDDDIRDKELAIHKDLRIYSQKDKILSETAKYTPFLNSLKSEDEEATVILKEIENLANKSSVYLIDLKPSGIKEAGTSKKSVVNIECEAQMEQLTDFMYNIENSSRLLRIEKYQITPKTKESSVARCSMTVSKLITP